MHNRARTFSLRMPTQPEAVATGIKKNCSVRRPSRVIHSFVDFFVRLNEMSVDIVCMLSEINSQICVRLRYLQKMISCQHMKKGLRHLNQGTAH